MYRVVLPDSRAAGEATTEKGLMRDRARVPAAIDCITRAVSEGVTLVPGA